VTAAQIAAERAALAELPSAKRARYVTALGLAPEAAAVLAGHPKIAAFFEACIAAGGDAVRCANFIQSEVLRDTTTSGLDAQFPVTATHVAELVKLVQDGAISGKQSKQVYAAMSESGRAPGEIVAELGLAVIGDKGTLRALAQSIVDKHPKQAESYRGGKTGLLGFFVGQMMKETRGSADPKLTNELLKAILEG
jgi:aspartyl-tRNA(Asn)/glutamyl-tRNA(Gln) amidotransferase subunit B